MTSNKPRHATGAFSATRWSIVLAAAGTPSQRSQDALEFLCQRYWQPLYLYVRRRGYSTEDAQDLTQEFFSKLLEKNYLGDARHERGRFRTFLLASLKHFLANEWDRARTQKRGGHQIAIALDTSCVENQFNAELAHHETPDRLYERSWALAVLDNVLARLRNEYVRAGRAEFFDAIKVTLAGSGRVASYEEVGMAFNMSGDAVKMAVHRLRHRYRGMLREEIAQGIGPEEDIEAEIRHLLSVLGS